MSSPVGFLYWKKSLILIQILDYRLDIRQKLQKSLKIGDTIRDLQFFGDLIWNVNKQVCCFPDDEKRSFVQKLDYWQLCTRL